MFVFKCYLCLCAGHKEDMMEIRPNIKWHQDLMRSFYSGHFPIYPIESPKMFIRKLFLAKTLKTFCFNFYSGWMELFIGPRYT